MHFLAFIQENILSPTILFFALGMVAGSLKSDLEVPESISRYLALYLMMAIGFKGGVAIATTDGWNMMVIGTMMAGLMVSFIHPFIGYGLLRMTTNLDGSTAAAVAAHYGSVSVVTFATACAFLKAHQVPYEGYIVAMLSLMEAPAILSGLFIAHRVAPVTRQHSEQTRKLRRDILTNGAILLLLGACLIGWITGSSGMEKMEGFLITPFQGVLSLFLLDMGLVVAQHLHYLKGFTLRLGLFGVYMPIIGAVLGLAIGWGFALDVGTGTLLMVLCASASYIAVPAAMRLALPEANPGVYVPMSLAITFPLNVLFGIPVYYSLANMVL